MKTIKTTHQATKGSEPETVFWLPFIDFYFSLSQHERDVKSIPRHMRKFLDNLMDTFSLPEVKWVPVTVEDVPEDYNRTICCGYRTYPEQTLVSPLVIRGRELEEIEAQVRTWNSSNGKEKSCYWKGSYSRPLSDCERHKLAEWFSETLIQETTPVLIYELRARVWNRTLADTMKYLREKAEEASSAFATVSEVESLSVV